MEIYTDDFITLAEKYANNIEKQLDLESYLILDEVCDFKQELCSTIYNRLSIEFKRLVTRNELGLDVESELFKIINNL